MPPKGHYNMQIVNIGECRVVKAPNKKRHFENSHLLDCYAYMYMSFSLLCD